MKAKVFLSVNKSKIRLTSERLNHIVTNHPEMTEFIFDLDGIITSPDFVLQGYKNEFFAIKQSNKYYLVVIYKEDRLRKDGFIITAYKTSNRNYLLKKTIVWRKK